MTVLLSIKLFTMCKLYIIILSSFILFVSCGQGSGQKKEEIDNQQTEQGVSSSSPKTKFKVDVRNELKGFFTHQKQDDAVEQVRPKGISFNANAEGIYSYFFIKNGKALSLKLHIQVPEYKADLIELHVDDEVETYEVNQSYSEGGSLLNTTETYSKTWYDQAINEADVEILRKAISAKNVSLVFKVKESGATLGTLNLSKEQCESLVRTIDYYDAQTKSAKIARKGMVNIRG